MPRVKALLDCLGMAVCDKARRALAGQVKFGDVLTDVARGTLEQAHKALPTDDLRMAILEVLSLPAADYRKQLDQTVDGLARVQAVPHRDALTDYLVHFPSVARRFLARPSDPGGRTVPEKIAFYKPEELLPLLPPHRATLTAGHTPAGLDNWTLRELIGVGETSETWLADDPAQPDRPAAIKFATDPDARAAVVARQELFHDVFKLANEAGVVPLTAVFLETDPPALESPFVRGYDLAAVMWDWRWSYDAAKPQAALALMRRLATIVGRAHAAGVVHRDLKPSNVLLHPTAGGKFTVWVTDYGWSQISAARSLQLAKGHTPRGEQQWLSLRGAHTPLYASPQQVRKEPPDPRDDVYALAVIWHQLLRRDPHAPPPLGTEWAEELLPLGLTEEQARLLDACLSTRLDRRPKDAGALAEMLAEVAVAVPSDVPDGSRLMRVKGHSSAELNVGSGSASAVGRASGVGSASAVGRASGVGRGASPSGQFAVNAKGHGGLPRQVSNSVGLTFALVPPGTFVMGSPADEPGRRGHEDPPHEVSITKPFYMGVFPVTQAQFETVCGTNPSAFKRNHGGGPDHPVESLTWEQAERFCAALAARPDEVLNRRAYRLPTEAEWERACRAGTTTPFATGTKLGPKDAHYAIAGAFGKTGGQGRTAPVGGFPPNPFGLYDLHGNVSEWVSDWFDEYYYFESPSADPPGPAEGTLKVVRGGCWTAFGNDCRSAARRGHAPGSPSNTVGFRVVMVVDR